MSEEPASGPHEVHPVVEWLAAYSWRLLVIAGALAAVLWAVGRLWVVFVPLLVAVFLTRILAPPAGWLGDHGWRPALGAAFTLVSFLLVLAVVATVIGAAVATSSVGWSRTALSTSAGPRSSDSEGRRDAAWAMPCGGRAGRSCRERRWSPRSSSASWSVSS
jgi:hypothetical protein